MRLPIVHCLGKYPPRQIWKYFDKQRTNRLEQILFPTYIIRGNIPLSSLSSICHVPPLGDHNNINWSSVLRLHSGAFYVTSRFFLASQARPWRSPPPLRLSGHGMRGGEVDDGEVLEQGELVAASASWRRTSSLRRSQRCRRPPHAGHHHRLPSWHWPGQKYLLLVESSLKEASLHTSWYYYYW